MSEERSISQVGTIAFNYITLGKLRCTFMDQFKGGSGCQLLCIIQKNVMSNMSVKGSKDETEHSVVSELQKIIPHAV